MKRRPCPLWRLPSSSTAIHRGGVSPPSQHFTPARDGDGNAIFKGSLGSKASADFAVSTARLDSETLYWLQSDPTLPRSPEELKERFNWEDGSSAAKALCKEEAEKVQVMGHSGTAQGRQRCNGLPAGTPLPHRLGAFVRALKTVNATALDRLAQLFREELSKVPDSQLGENGQRVRDVHP